MKEIINLNPLMFHLAGMYAASTEDTRYYLKSCYIEQGPDGKGCFITATDGHRLLSFYDESGTCPEKGTIISVGDRKTLARFCKVTRAIARRLLNRPVTFDDKCRLIINRGINHLDLHAIVAINTADGVRMDHHIHPETVSVDGTYPDWRRIVPEIRQNDNRGYSSYDAGYLGAFGKVSLVEQSTNGIYDEHRNNLITLSHSDPYTPCIVAIGGWYEDCLAVLMPKKGVEECPSLPVIFRN